MSGRTKPKSPQSGINPNTPCNSSTASCPNCTPSSVVLDVQKNTLTLKHDRDSKLEVKIAPAGITVDSCRIEIKRASATTWCTLSTKRIKNPWQAKIAGKFKLRGVATICGVEHKTAEKDLEVQFPSYAEIVSDAACTTQAATEWQNTLNDCTQTPNQRRERGFWIKLNTASNSYEFTTTVTGGFNGPTAGASVPLPARPADSPATPSPCANGATYQVASFHTHTPTEFRAAANPPGTTRGIGPSGADNRVDNSDDVPGVVYDYTESPAASGSIPMGHPKTSAAQLYHSRGRNRRSTPN